MSWGRKEEGSPRRAGLDSFQGLASSRKHLVSSAPAYRAIVIESHPTLALHD